MLVKLKQIIIHDRRGSILEGKRRKNKKKWRKVGEGGEMEGKGEIRNKNGEKDGKSKEKDGKKDVKGKEKGKEKERKGKTKKKK